MIVYGISFIVFLTPWVAMQANADESFCGPYHIGLLENMTLSLRSYRQDMLTHSQENRKLITEIGKDLGQDLKDLRNEITTDIGQELKELRQERIAQHSEMMYAFNQILKYLETGKDETYTPARDCAALYKFGKRISGVYNIKPDGMKEGFDVFCDMEYDGGGWTVIQRRGNYGTPSEYFYKTWNEYKHGFGNLKGEHWLGNDRISTLSRQGTYELHIEMLDYDHNRIYARYRNFTVEGEDQLYKLHVGNFSGNDRDSMTSHKGMSFSTHDRDNDLNTSDNCAVKYAGAWWYYGTGCFVSNLNSKKDRNKYYLNWLTSKRGYVDISFVLMKIRPISF